VFTVFVFFRVKVRVESVGKHRVI